MYVKNQLGSRTTLDQHGVALTVMRLLRKMWKVLTSSNCNVYMGYSMTFMLIALIQTKLFLYGGSYLCNVRHDLARREA